MYHEIQAENKIYSKKLVSSTIKCRPRVKSMSKHHSLFTLLLSVASKKWVICRKLVVLGLAFYPWSIFYCAGHRLFTVYFILCLNFMVHIQFTFYCRYQPLLKYYDTNRALFIYLLYSTCPFTSHQNYSSTLVLVQLTLERPGPWWSLRSRRRWG